LKNIRSKKVGLFYQWMAKLSTGFILQFFIGLERYQDDKPPFDPSLMVHFRKRLDKDTMMAINEMICQQGKQLAETAVENENKKSKDPQDPGEPPVSGDNQDNMTETTCPTHKGKLLLDATCGTVRRINDKSRYAVLCRIAQLLIDIIA
jgi:hypothetical protein